PPGAEVISAAGAVALSSLGLAAARGAELGREADVSWRFELNRLGRTVAATAVLTALLVALASTGFLFPQPGRQTVIPPQRPKVAPALPDQVLFTYTGPQVPLRMGVLDVYDGRGWLLPAYDPARLVQARPAAAGGAQGIR